MSQASGLRITNGLVVSDRELLPELHRIPEAAYQASEELIRRWHGRGRLRYAVTPRFSLSCSDAMLEACGAALVARRAVRDAGARFAEAAKLVVADVHVVCEHAALADEREALVGVQVIARPREQARHDLDLIGVLVQMAGEEQVLLCAQFLGSGLFPMKRHLDCGARFALGTDVGAGTSFSLFSEGLHAYLGQMLRPDGQRLGPVELLYLATRAGAQALELADQVGDLTPGKSADLIVIRPPEGSTLKAVLARSSSPGERLGAIFTLAREASVHEVRVAGRVAMSRAIVQPR